MSLLDEGDLIHLRAPMKLLVDGVLVRTVEDAEVENQNTSRVRTTEKFTVIDSICYG